jgi:hypothetical protein
VVADAGLSTCEVARVADSGRAIQDQTGLVEAAGDEKRRGYDWDALLLGYEKADDRHLEHVIAKLAEKLGEAACVGERLDDELGLIAESDRVVVEACRVRVLADGGANRVHYPETP